MTAATHTPGPWAFSESELTPGRFSIYHYGPLAYCGDTGDGIENARANARLIAAAPDLLDALLDALPYVEDVLADPVALACFKPGTVQRNAAAIRAAIARATGAA